MYIIQYKFFCRQKKISQCLTNYRNYLLFFSLCFYLLGDCLGGPFGKK